ncbi:hypothetical protein ANCCAN_24861 [Ancylostoma caninum]|uniref:Leucine Rich repeat-containing domain protein n=1 Tax=Ancylostoma caninum TaxID=29170 RepID=A0A368FB15_ANCCA|nr:hypothetical protein ANCCAN_24861 [Ancylostoma caninum]
MLLEDLRLYPDVEAIEIERCRLTDSDLMEVDFVAASVKFLNLRGNELVHPWIFLPTKFPNVFHLDLRGNRLEGYITSVET